VLADEVLVERALTGSPAAVAQLAGVVETLTPWPHLSGTLCALYDHDLDRSATADALHVARRTLTNRLDRIHRLTGVHPTSARGVQTFMTALAAHRLVRDDAGADRDPDRRGVG
jgi:sugar diacid utilization regulator